MKCAVHPELDAAGFCRNCGKPLCQQCSREVRNALYCEQCLAGMMAPQGPAVQFAAPAAPPAYGYAPPGVHHGPNPGTACALGFIPGLGAIYNGEYVKGLIHVMIFGGIIAILSSDGTPDGLKALLGIFLGVFCCYMPIEAYKTARARQLGLPTTGFFGESAPAASGQDLHRHRNYTGSIIVIAVGVVFLLATTGAMNWRWIGDFWPLLLIVIGVAMILKRRTAS